MKSVKTACCVSLSMRAFWLLKARMLKRITKPMKFDLFDKRRIICHPFRNGEEYHVFTYTIR